MIGDVNKIIQGKRHDTTFLLFTDGITWREREKNPYIKYLKQPVTMRLDRDSVDYFKSLAEETGIPYQTMINLYLRDCAINHRKLQMQLAL